jgi:hypothetical protein
MGRIDVTDEFEGWYRVGGKGLQFYATDEEIEEWLREMLPPDLGPYTFLVQEWKTDAWVTYEHPIERIRESFARSRSTNHWIKSTVLSPGLSPDAIRGYDGLRKLSFSGLIRVLPGGDRDGRLSDAYIGIVDRIRHEATRKERRQPAYLRIFERLRRSMRRRLVVQTEDFPMTARAADAHVRGDVTFVADPIGLRD